MLKKQFINREDKMKFKSLITTMLLCLVSILVANLAFAAKVDEPQTSNKAAEPLTHFHPLGKMPSEHTIALRKQIEAGLPFSDKRDFEEYKRGFIAAPLFKQIMADAGHVAWDMESYEFLLGGEDFASIHPSLQRQAVLNMNYGLYEVLPDKIYQVRGFDLANITFIKSDTGWIIFDPLTAKETARAALDFINEKLGKRPVVAVIYSHSHADHFGGVRGVVDEKDVESGKVMLIAPEGFMHHAISENIYAGNAMTRRLHYQYGVLLNRSPFGHVDQSIGKNVAAGNLGLIAPNRIVSGDFETITVDGVEMVFQNTPGTEAPAEMNTYFPQFKVFWGAENIVASIHNIYTLRGAQVRDALRWSKYINEALYKFGEQTEILISSHNWPRFGNERVKEVMRAQRDAYANLNNSVLFYANQGVTINEIHNVYKVPKSLQQQWSVRSYHGSEMHNSRGVLNRYLGYWDANPTTLIPLSPADSAPLYVEMMGGSAKIIAKGKTLIADGKYLEATEILNKLVYAEPNNTEGRQLLADAFEQIGYQMESPSVRNSFLAAAYELRTGISQGNAARSVGPDVVRAMGTDLWLDFLGISIDSARAEGLNFTINLITPDNKETFVVEMSNATLTNIKGVKAAKPDLTITINRSDLNQIMMGLSTFEAMKESGKAKFEGNYKHFEELRNLLVVFTPDFEIMPGTAALRKATEKGNAFALPDMLPLDAD